MTNVGKKVLNNLANHANFDLISFYKISKSTNVKRYTQQDV